MYVYVCIRACVCVCVCMQVSMCVCIFSEIFSKKKKTQRPDVKSQTIKNHPLHEYFLSISAKKKKTKWPITFAHNKQSALTTSKFWAW